MIDRLTILFQFGNTLSTITIFGGRAIYTSFMHHSYIQHLLDTGYAVIAECNGKYRYWGTGVYMSNPLSEPVQVRTS